MAESLLVRKGGGGGLEINENFIVNNVVGESVKAGDLLVLDDYISNTAGTPTNLFDTPTIYGYRMQTVKLGINKFLYYIMLSNYNWVYRIGEYDNDTNSVVWLTSQTIFKTNGNYSTNPSLVKLKEDVILFVYGNEVTKQVSYLVLQINADNSHTVLTDTNVTGVTNSHRFDSAVLIQDNPNDATPTYEISITYLQISPNNMFVRAFSINRNTYALVQVGGQTNYYASYLNNPDQIIVTNSGSYVILYQSGSSFNGYSFMKTGKGFSAILFRDSSISEFTNAKLIEYNNTYYTHGRNSGLPAIGYNSTSPTGNLYISSSNSKFYTGTSDTFEPQAFEVLNEYNNFIFFVAYLKDQNSSRVIRIIRFDKSRPDTFSQNGHVATISLGTRSSNETVVKIVKVGLSSFILFYVNTAGFVGCIPIKVNNNLLKYDSKFGMKPVAIALEEKDANQTCKVALFDYRNNSNAVK